MAVKKEEVQKAYKERTEVSFRANNGTEEIKGQILRVSDLTAEIAFWRNGFLSQVKVPFDKLEIWKQE